MPTPPGTTQNHSGLARQDKTIRDLSAKVEELQTEIGTLRRENAELRLADGEHGRLEEARRSEHHGSDRVEQALWESEEQLRALIAASAQAIYRMSPDWREMRELQGGQFLADTIEPNRNWLQEYIHPDDRPWVCEVIRRAIRTGTVFELEHRILRADGTLRWTASRAVPVRNADGEIVEWFGAVRDITERKQAEEALRESKEKLQTLFQLLPVGISVLDEHRKVLDVNPALGDILDLSRDDLLHGAYENRRYIRPDGTEMPAAEFPSSRVITEQTAIRDVEIGIEKEDHSTIWTNVSAVPLPISDWRILVTTVDITQRKRAEEALRESEENYARFFWDDLTGDSQVSVDGRIQICNPAFLAIFGFTSLSEALESNIALLYPDLRERADLLSRLRQERTLYHHTMTLRRRDGQLVTIVANLTGIFDDGGELVGTRAYMYDDTDRKRVEDTLKESEERYRILVELSPEAILLQQDEGYIYANPAAVRLFRASSLDDFADKTIFDLFHPDYQALIDARSREIMATGSVSPAEVEIIRLDGQRAYVESSRVQITYKGKPALMLVMRDISRRKEAEEALARRTDDLIRKSEELEAARDEANMYLDIMTHDVRNANNVSSMYADLLVDLADGALKTYAEKLHDSIDRSSEILRNVATIRRASEEAGHLMSVNLDAVIRNEIEAFPGASIRYVDPPVSVLADSLLPTVFTNLIGNAVKHGGADVEITITVEERDGEVLVTVEDTGPGVPDEVKVKLFTRFERGMARGSGEGLGLYIVRTLVTRYGGKVWIEDRVPGCPEEGAAFRFTLQKAA